MAAKKEGLLGSGAGAELANWFKKKSSPNSTSASTSSSGSSSNTQSMDVASSIISSLAANLQKKVLSDPKISAALASNKSLSRLLAESSIDEDDNRQQQNLQKKTSITASQSEFDFNKVSASVTTASNRNSMTSSSSLAESLHTRAEIPDQALSTIVVDASNSDSGQQDAQIISVLGNSGGGGGESDQATSTPVKIPSSSSFQRMFDADSETSLRKRLLTTKKSIESSLGNMKTRMNSTSSIPNLQNAAITEKPDAEQSPPESPSTSLITNEPEIDDTFESNIQEPPTSNDTTISIARDEGDQQITKHEARQVSISDHDNRNSKPALILLAIFIFYLIFVSILPRGPRLIVTFYSIGLASGILLMSGLFYLCIKYDLLKYITQSSSDSKREGDGAVVEQVQSLLLQTAVQKENKSFDGIYKGWMNELKEKYDPQSYFLNKTRSVYLNLDGHMLRLQTTSSRVPKRAVCGETISNVSFKDQRIYDISDSDIYILPDKLCRKRYWSKKYPICLSGVKLLSRKKVNADASATTTNTPSTPPSSQAGLSFLDESMAKKPSDNQIDISNTLILFARTDREKEEWFKLFKKASAKHLVESSVYLKQLKSRSKSFITRELSSNLKKESSMVKLVYNANTDRIVYKLADTKDSENSESMNKSDDSPSETTTSGTSTPNPASTVNTAHTQTESGLLYDSSLNFMNTFLIRIFADFFTHQHWISLIKNKIQNKLTKIKVPYFMEELRIMDLDLGSVIPLIKQCSEPWYDEKGLWVHLEIDYSGGLQMSLATKLNLMKLKSSSTNSGNISFKSLTDPDEAKSHSVESLTSSDKGESSQVTEGTIKHKKRRPGYLYSDEEDSPESSGDEYVHTGFNDEEDKLIETANSTKKILGLVNKIAASNYFQKATENKYIKKAMENVSNCQLLLSVEVKKIAGTVALNIPPLPSDRIWYGFVSSPQMTLVATPQVGEKEVSYSAISDFIADKLKQEFQKVLVFPNMDDIYIPLLNSEIFCQNW